MKKSLRMSTLERQNKRLKEALAPFAMVYLGYLQTENKQPPENLPHHCKSEWYMAAVNALTYCDATDKKSAGEKESPND